MIVFDLDGTLADCEHRRHFVDKSKHFCNDCATWIRLEPIDHLPCPTCGKCPTNFKPDWKSFYEACGEDKPIKPVCKLFDDLAVDNEIQIWSGRCESVRQKTINWLYENIPYSRQILKMRPIGDNTPDDQLKENWLDEYLNSTSPRQWEEEYKNKHPIDFVIDYCPKIVRMWRRRGIFVFDVNQSPDKEF